MKRLLTICVSVLLSACSSPRPAAKQLEPDEVPAPVNRLLFGGDVMLTRHVEKVWRSRKDPAWPFREIATEFAKADLAFVNLESPFHPKPGPPRSGMVFRASPEAIESLKLAGIDVVSLANNHVRDGLDDGLLFTMDWLKKNGVAFAGAGRSQEEARKGVILQRNGVKFGFLAYTYDQRNGNHKTDDPRINGLDLVRLREDIRDIRREANVTIVSLHAGKEYAPRPDAEQIQLAHAAIEAGATLVVGHHPHVVQPCEDYRTGVICYSLGNLIFDQTIRGTNQGLVLEAEFKGPMLRKARTRKIEIRNTQPVFVP